MAKHDRGWAALVAEYEQPPASVREFVESPLYLGAKDDVFPQVVSTLEAIIEGGHQEAVLCWGIGSGKSYLAALAICYMVYRTLCLRDPQEALGLAPGSPITFVNMAPTARQAEGIVFGEVHRRISQSGWFKRHFPPENRGSGELRLAKGIRVIPGNSTETFALGFNVLGAVVDEVNWFEDGAADEIYEGLRQRIRSRFGDKGLLLAISSPKHVEDFTERRMRGGDGLTPRPPLPGGEGKNGDGASPPAPLPVPLCAVGGEGGTALPPGPLPAREGENGKGASPPAPLLAGEGRAAKADGRLNPRPPLPASLCAARGDGRNGGGGAYLSRLAAWEARPVRYYSGDTFTWGGLEIPAEYRADFERDPVRAMRDLGARPTQGAEGYLADLSVLEAACQRHWRHPWDDQSGLAEWFRSHDAAEWFVHVDLGLKRDACGIAMAACEQGGPAPVARVEFMLRLAPPRGGEVDLGRVREIILALRGRGFNIAQVSYDGFESADSRQILRRYGIATKLVSVDRDSNAYMTLRDLLVAGRLVTYAYEPFMGEMRALRVRSGWKVDHPPGGSKDVADAVAGAVSEAVKRWGSGREVGGRVV